MYAMLWQLLYNYNERPRYVHRLATMQRMRIAFALTRVSWGFIGRRPSRSTRVYGTEDERTGQIDSIERTNLVGRGVAD